MDKSAEEILEEEQVRLMTCSSRAGSWLGGGFGTLLPGQEKRARWVARRLPNNVYEAHVQVPLAMEHHGGRKLRVV